MIGASPVVPRCILRGMFTIEWPTGLSLSDVASRFRGRPGCTSEPGQEVENWCPFFVRRGDRFPCSPRLPWTSSPSVRFPSRGRAAGTEAPLWNRDRAVQTSPPSWCWLQALPFLGSVGRRSVSPGPQQNPRREAGAREVLATGPEVSPSPRRPEPWPGSAIRTWKPAGQHDRHHGSSLQIGKSSNRQKQIAREQVKKVARKRSSPSGRRRRSRGADPEGVKAQFAYLVPSPLLGQGDKLFDAVAG